MKKVDRFELAVDKLHSALSAHIDRVATYMRNEAPPGARKQPADERLAQYLPMREDPNAWAQIVQQHGIKGALDYYRTMEGLAKRKFQSIKASMGLPDEVTYKSAPVPQPIMDALMQAAQLAQGQGQPQPQPPQQQQVMPNAVPPAGGEMAPNGGEVLPPGAGGQSPMGYPA